MEARPRLRRYREAEKVDWTLLLLEDFTRASSDGVLGLEWCSVRPRCLSRGC